MRSAIAPALLSTLLLSAAPAAAATTVTSPRVVSPQGMVVQEGAVGTGGGRTAVVMSGITGSGKAQRWSVRARLGQGTRLGAARRLWPAGASDLQVMVGTDGTAVAAWNESLRTPSMGEPPNALRVAVARPGEGFGQTQTLSTGTFSALGGVAVTRAGRAVVAWRSAASFGGEARMLASVAEPGRRFGRATTLQAVHSTAYYPPELATLPNGRVVVTWADAPPAPTPETASKTPVVPPRVFATTLAPASQVFEPAVQLASEAGWGSGPDAAGGPGGAAVGWTSWPSRGALPPWFYSIVVVSAAGKFGAPVIAPTISPAWGRIGVATDGALLALDRTVTTAGAEDDTIETATVLSSVQPAGGAFSPLARISTASRIAGPPQLATMLDRTVAAWSEIHATRVGRVQLMVRPSGGTWTPLHALSARLVDDYTVRVAASTRSAVVSWVQERDAVSRSGGRLYMATYRP